MAILETTRAIDYTFPHTRGGYSVTIPAGTRVAPVEGEPGTYWIDAFDWCDGNGIVRHDAEHYGIRVQQEDVAPRA